MNKEYADPERFGFGNGSYFYDNLYSPNYYIQEQKRLKQIVKKKAKPKKSKGKVEPSQELKNQIKNLQKMKVPARQWKKRQGGKVS